MRGSRPEAVAYEGPAARLQDVWIAMRANLRAVLEEVTLADVASGELPAEIVGDHVTPWGVGVALATALNTVVRLGRT